MWRGRIRVVALTLAALFTGVRATSAQTGSVETPSELLQAILIDEQQGTGEQWAFSGNGGYVFRYFIDLFGDGSDEVAIKFSIAPNHWHLFTTDPENGYLGEIRIKGISRLAGKAVAGKTVLRSSYSANYDSPPLKAHTEYIIDTTIYPTGLQTSHREVGIDATHDEFEAIRTSSNTELRESLIEGIELSNLKDYTSSAPNWKPYTPAEFIERQGYPIHVDHVDTPPSFHIDRAIEALQKPPKTPPQATASDLPSQAPVKGSMRSPSDEVQPPTPAETKAAEPEAPKPGRSILLIPVLIGAAALLGLLAWLIMRGKAKP